MEQPPDGDAAEEPSHPPQVPPPPKPKRPFYKELPVLVLIAFVLAVLIKTFLVQAFYIPSESMVPTLQVDDRVLVNKLVYRIRDPRRGEVIVFIAHRDETQKDRSLVDRFLSLFEGFGVSRPAETDFIKRVIGLPGETIEVRSGVVTITPVRGPPFVLREPYVADAPDDSDFGPFLVPEDQYFVMGDNRPNSADSRTALGAIARSEIIGKAFVRLWPPKRFRLFRTPSYADG